MVRPATQLGPVGLILPTLPQTTSPRWLGGSAAGGTGGTTGADDDRPGAAAALADLCRTAEELGAGALWATDHLYWHGPALEAMVTLSVAATATRRAMLGTCVVQLPLRRAQAVAKQAASLQFVSDGRMILGVGVGSHAGEYEQAGVSYGDRGRQLDAGIAELRRSWASGEGVTVGDIAAGGAERYRQLPAPSPVPVWVGGSSEAALRRAARLADGWMPLFLSPTEYGAALERLTKEIDRAGRPADAVTRAIVLFVSLDDDPDRGRARGTAWMGSMYGIPAHAFERHLEVGTADSIAATVAAFRAAGAEHVGVYITDDEPLAPFEQLMAAMPAAGITT
jgi:alkanesulfonate monooxygenase SsuD/methylene tetrahydromethanopterin reductase-like flavin-dependent oxidoreductase (luciferase family)